MRLRLHFTLIFVARISHQSIDNNVKIFLQMQTHTQCERAFNARAGAAGKVSGSQ